MLEILGTIDSTNSELRRRILQGQATSGSALLAHTQTGGRGRAERQWLSASGNLYSSMLFRPLAQMAEQWAQATLVVGLGLYHHVMPFVSDAAKLHLKWPNDLLYDGAKLAGILVEAEGDFLIVGIGVNLAHTPDVPGRTACALSDSAVSDGRSDMPTAAHFAKPLWVRIQQDLQRWDGEGFGAFQAAWQQAALPVGTMLQVHAGKTMIQGAFEGVTADGHLRLRDNNATSRTITVGEVI